MESSPEDSIDLPQQPEVTGTFTVFKLRRRKRAHLGAEFSTSGAALGLGPLVFHQNFSWAHILIVSLLLSLYAMSAAMARELLDTI